MNEYLKLKKSNCKHCYKCIRNCHVKAISFSEDQAIIIQDECILCGQCFVNCPQNAKYVRNDVEQAKRLLHSGKNVYASIAPSFLANYPHASKATMEAALKALGFFGAEETALGATVVKRQYDAMINEGAQPVILSSCCHSVNTLIQKYYPDALACLAKVDSPMLLHGKMIKQAHPDAYVVFIGPCISKKAEADQYPGSVDVVLTFDELDEWLQEENVEIMQEQEGDIGGKTRLFPIPGGILRSMEAANPAYAYITVDGIENCVAALKDVANGSLQHCFVELSACVGGCVGGPVMSKKGKGLLRDYIRINASAGQKDFSVESCDAAVFEKKISFLPVFRSRPGNDAIEEVLRRLGKYKPEDELNCGSCGYETCRRKAEAVVMGKAELSMCLPYLMARAQSFSDTIIANTPNGLIVLNEDLQVQQINEAACSLLHIIDPSAVRNQPVVNFLDPTPYLEVLQSNRNIYERTAYLPEYNCTVSQTIVRDMRYHVLVVVLRDITQEERERAYREQLSRETIAITDKVIEKQMRSVQEIASLLGETTAETQVALTKLKEIFANE